MRNPIVSPRFDEAQYKGQDVVHYGIRVPLSMTPPELFAKLPADTRKKIKKPAGMVYAETKTEDLQELRAMWFDPADPDFPAVMDEEDHWGITARDAEDKMLGAILLRRQGRNLFVHHLVASAEGKAHQAPLNLVWEAVKWFHGRFHSLDMGVSYNPKRYRFFKQFEIETYPIILKKPFYVPVIRLSPFRSIEDKTEQKAAKHDWEKERVTFLPRGNYAIYAVLKHAGVGPGDLVTIVKTFGSDFISGCVTSTIERTGAEWKLRDIVRQGTKAVIAIHEFGIPVYQDRDMDIVRHANALGIPVIEDCAWRSTPVWPWSDMQVFSMQKMMNINYGGMLRGVHIPDDKLWEWGCLDAVKRDMIRYEPVRTEGAEVRVRNWKRYHEMVLADGMMPDDCYSYERAVGSGDWVPTVYLQKFESDEIANAIVARLEEFGIQAGRYWGEPVVYLPIHQNMTLAEVEYMFAVVRGYFNLCRDFKGIIKEEVKP